MPHILKNDQLEVHIDLPGENYSFSRFDQTGKITEVRYKNIRVSTTELTDTQDEHLFGKAFYNEFGIDTALGFDEADIGGWFHKIGVGLLKKEDDEYLFHKPYAIQPAEFEVGNETDKLKMICRSQAVLGYAYVLKKEIELQDNRFILRYHLHNTGEKAIVTDEYAHNFTAINDALMGPGYQLSFSFPLNTEKFDAIVNPENAINIGQQGFSFMGSPTEQFFFSNLTGSRSSPAKWELRDLKNKIGISETGSFQTSKVNLWGWKHVISPELFYRIELQPGQSAEWSRTYEVFEVE
ncbi:MAG: hypothetical protein AAFP70_15830 [Calditrichota bacterium]